MDAGVAVAVAARCKGGPVDGHAPDRSAEENAPADHLASGARERPPPEGDRAGAFSLLY